MLTYEPGYWGVAMIWQWKGSVFPKAMVWAVPCAILAGVLHRVFESQDSIKEIVGIGDVAANVFGGFNFILGFLVVFRSQQAYSRWWEGGTLLQQLRGEWFNAFSSLMAFKNNAPEKQEEVEKFQQQLVRLFSLLYGCALGQVSHMKTNCFEMINLEGFDTTSLAWLESDNCPDKCEITLQWIQRLIVESEQKGILKIAPPILSRVYNELGNGIVNLNNANKIKEFLIPFPLAQMIMVMLTFHAMFTPLVCAATVKTTLWASLLTFVVVFSYWSVLYIALELEMPFGDDLNDLPLQEMARDMNKSLEAMMDPLSSKVPSYEYHPEMDNLERVFVDLSSGRKDLAGSNKQMEKPPRSSRLTACSLRKSPTKEMPGMMEDFTFYCRVNLPSRPDAEIPRREFLPEAKLPGLRANCFGEVPGEVEVKVVGDHKAPSSFEKAAVASAVPGYPQLPALRVDSTPVEKIGPPASGGHSPAPPTIVTAPQRQPGEPKFVSEDKPSRSQVTAGSGQRQRSSSELADIIEIDEIDEVA